MLLGIDPLEVANEGKVVMGVPPEDAETILATLRMHKYGKNAGIIGKVVEGRGVIMETAAGGERFIEPPLWRSSSQGLLSTISTLQERYSTNGNTPNRIQVWHP